ncbi:polysaccharide biosynthesis tyrosine autokinase [candidate division KSB1 bacterium]|nr:polysaccharide biosynthesis tyrosine autokinase [candidate division KSB1 bacterium]
MEENNFQLNEPDQSISVIYFQIIRRRKWLIFFCTIGILIPVILVTMYIRPVYEAQATILYDEPKDTMFALDVGQPFYNKSAIMNVTEQIKSRLLARQVANSLSPEIKDLFKLPSTIPYNLTPEDLIAFELQKNLSIGTIRGSDIVNISVRAHDPIAAQVITNTYVEKLIALNIKSNREEISSIRDFIERQINTFQQKVQIAEDSLREFRERNKLVELSNSSKDIVKRVTDIEVTYNEALSEQEALKQRIKYMEAKRKELAPTLAYSDNSDAQQMKNQLWELENQYYALQFKGTSENDSQMTALQEQINSIKHNLIQFMINGTKQNSLDVPLAQVQKVMQESATLEFDLVAATAKVTKLKEVMDEYEADMQSLPGKELELARYIRERTVNDKIYTTLLEKHEEAKITEAGKVGDIRIIDLADAPIKPILPKKKRNLALGLVLGMGFGIGLAFFLDTLDTSLKTHEQVEKALGVPVLGIVPMINTNGFMKIKRNPKHRIQDYEKRIVQSFSDSPEIIEAYRNIQLNFEFSNVEGNIKCLLLTSAGPGEGKTLTTINISRLFSLDRKKTVLVDCDMRRPMLHRILKKEQTPGLSNILINRAQTDECIHEIYENFYLLPSGTVPPNPSQLLGGARMQELLEEINGKFDQVVLDSPPVIAVTDAIILSRLVGGVCLLIRSGKTSRDAARRAKQILEEKKTQLIGVILNEINMNQTYGYYDSYYKYYSKKEQATLNRSLRF